MKTNSQTSAACRGETQTHDQRKSEAVLTLSSVDKNVQCDWYVSHRDGGLPWPAAVGEACFQAQATAANRSPQVKCASLGGKERGVCGWGDTEKTG